MDGLTQQLLDSLNVEQQREDNRQCLDKLGGIDMLCKMIGVDIEKGLTTAQVKSMREKFGTNLYPESPMNSFLELLLAALSDTTLLILIAAASASLIIGILEDPGHGYIEGAAIFIAVFLVSMITAGNDYSKQLQFRALENSSAKDERTSVLRDGSVTRVNPRELVVGDIIVLQVINCAGY